MPKRIRILDWKEAALPQLVREIVHPVEGGRGVLDLRETRLVVPTRQSVRLLGDALARHAAERGQLLLPPSFSLPEQLFAGSTGGAPPAGPRRSFLAWTRVLEEVAPSEFSNLLGEAPNLSGLDQRLVWGRVLREVEALLGENLLRFGDVPGEALAPGEEERWRELAELERRFLAVLDDWGLSSEADFRLAACAHPRPPEGCNRLLLALVPDPLPGVVSFLEALLTAHPELLLEVLTWGPDAVEAFDDWGRPRPSYWRDRNPPAPVLEERFHPLRSVEEEALRVRDLLQPNLERPGAVALGVQSGELVSPLKRLGVPCFDPSGEPLSMTWPYPLLGSLAEWLESDGFEPFARLVRAPWIVAVLEGEVDGFHHREVLFQLDRIRARSLPDTASDVRRKLRPGSSLAGVFPCFDDWKRALRKAPFGTSFLELINGWANFLDGLPPLIPVWNRWVEVLPEAVADAEALAPGSPAAFLRALLALLQDEVFYDDSPGEGLRVQGWLELPLVEAPHLVLAELADEHLPGVVRSHPFLPDALRSRLGLRDEETRHTRDAWLLSCLDQSRRRKGRLDLTLSRSNSRGEPQKPTRLLFQGAPDTLPARVQAAFREPPVLSEDPNWTLGWKLRPPGPAERPFRPQRLSVTAFRSYLRCPFRFFLERSLGMESFENRKMEMDAGEFGTLIHDTLEAFAREETIRDSMDPPGIAEFFRERATALIHQRYGQSLPLPLEIQLESVIQRLRAWSEHEAQSRREGWRIDPALVEWTPPEDADDLEIEGYRITGKIDRIERHEETGALRLLDFKTWDAPEAPFKSHLKKWSGADEDSVPPYARVMLAGKPHRWLDLQLPLYAWMAHTLFPESDLQVGYVHLPRAVGKAGVDLWTGLEDPDLLASAVECARGVLRDIRADIFWPPAEDLKYDAFDGLFFDSLAGELEVAAFHREGGA